MDITVLEHEKEKLKVETTASLTLVNALNENMWKQKATDVAAYNVGHPYLSKPVLLIKSKNPKKTLIDAADAIAEDVGEFRKKLAAALK